MFRKAFSYWKCSAMFGAVYHANTLTLVDYDAQNKKHRDEFNPFVS